MIHMYGPRDYESFCREERRERLSDAKPTHVPVIRHHAEFCGACLRVAEVGPTDKDGNRIMPAIMGAGISEHEFQKVQR